MYTLTCMCSKLEDGSAENRLSFPLTSGPDPEVGIEAWITSLKPGLEFPESESREKDFCRDDELRRFRITPE